MKFVGTNSNPEISGIDAQPGHSNYFLGNDPSKWRADVPNYARVRYHDLYRGIDLIYYGNQNHLEYDLVVSPGASSEKIRFQFEGARQIRLNANGDLLVKAGSAELRLVKPRIYQEIDGVTHDIDGHYVLRGGRQVGFKIAPYNRNRRLVIDPILSYASYLGGNSDDVAYAVAMDGAGNSYTAGYTLSANFPATAGAYKSTAPGGSSDVFVAKYTSAGALVFSTYLGGGGADVAYGIAVDSAGVYVTGSTTSADFPTSAGVWQTSLKGSPNAFVASLNAAGSALLYSTYLGGTGTEIAFGIAVDGSHEATVTGTTSSANYPTTTGAWQTSFGGGNTDVFLTRLNAAGTALVYSTLIGGSGDETGSGIAVDSLGNSYIAGYTGSANFPVTAGAAQPTSAGDYDAFATAVNTAGTAPIYSTFLGGTLEDYGYGIAVDANQNAYITGVSASTNYPVTPGVIQQTEGGGYDAVVTKLTAAGAIAWSTYIGGSGDDFGRAIAVDSHGNSYITGDTSSTNFPLTPDATQTTNSADFTTFVTQLNSTGTALGYSTYLGGSGFETGSGIALDSTAAAWVVGYTVSPDFPITSATAAQTALGGGSDAFLAKVIGCGFTLNSSSMSFTPAGGFGSVGVTGFNACPWAATSNAAWLTITAGASGRGNGSVNFSVAANMGTTPLLAVLTIAGQQFTVTEAANQTITIAPLSNTALSAGSVTLTATSTSNLAISFGSTTQSVCTVAGNTITLLSFGLCTITADQPGNTQYTAATEVGQSFNVTSQTQTITFTQGNVQISPAPLALSATANSGLTVTFSSTTPSVCTVSSSAVTLVSTGTCTVTASQAGNVTYAAAPPVVRSFQVSPSAQTITFGALSNASFSPGTITLTATASSGLPVNYASTTQAVCTASGNAITLVATGTCSITASQSGNNNYAPAAPVSQSFTVNRGSQAITFGALANVGFSSSTITLTATANSGLPVGYSSTTQPVCTVAGNAITLVTLGTCSISASQSGSSNYNAATSVTQSFTVTQGSQAITFGPLTNITLPGSSVSITATASSGLPVTLTSTTTSVCTVGGTSVTPVTAGTCTIKATQTGSANYAAASPVTQSFTINPATSG
ncbi:MAG TPA: SBBP repeat-containing protein, partial [Bryobacteraceae bacterium]|nr:SBBP repeat-containing protein [Bryobacteraceae bacterium]